MSEPITFNTTVKKAMGFDLAHKENQKGQIADKSIAGLVGKKVTVTINPDEGTEVTESKKVS